MTLSSKNRKRTTVTIFIAVIFVFIYYIINYAYNKTQQPQFESSPTIGCIIDICINYDNIRECIHIGKPTLFKIDFISDQRYYDLAVKNVEYLALKEGCR